MKRLRVALASAIGLVLFSAAAVVAPPAAIAADLTSQMTFSNLQYVGSPPTKVGDEFQVSADWSVPDNTAHAGDTFAFSLGPGVTPTYTSAFVMRNPNGDAVANCTVSGSTFTCTFTSFVDSNPLGIHGEMSLRLTASTEQSAGDIVIIDTGTLTYTLPTTGIGPGGGGGGGGGGYPMPTMLVKNGQVRSDGRIQWSISVPAAQMMDASGNDIEFTDTWDPRLVFDSDPGSQATFYKVTASTGQSDGLWPGTGPIQYTKTVTDTGMTFTIHGINTLSDPADTYFNIVYYTLAPWGTPDGTKFTNTISGKTTVDAEVTYVSSGGSGTGTGPGGIKVTKVDSIDQSLKLAGAEFDVKNAGGTVVAHIGPTASNGLASVANLAPGDYTLVETTPPAGHVASATPIAVTVHAGSVTPVTVANAPTTGAVAVTKVDAANSATTLAGAIFDIKDAGGAVVGQVGPTAADGTASKSGLPAGSYTLVETTAPVGYDKAADTPVTIQAGQTTPVTVQDAKSFVAAPAITVVKSADVTVAHKVGDVINYTFLVTNTGNVPLSNVTVNDQFVAPAGPAVTVTCSPNTLAPGASVTCTASPYTVTQADVDNGKVDNKATATGTPPTGEPVTSPEVTKDVPILAPALSLVKSASPAQAHAVGDVITYSFVVTNTGNQTLTDVNVTDVQASPAGSLDAAPVCPVTTLAPGATTTCTATYTVTQADVDNGSVNDTAIAHGTSPSDDAVDSNESSAVVPIPIATLTLVKSTGTAEVTRVGQQVTYLFVVTNTGNVTVKDVTVADTLRGPSLRGNLTAIMCLSLKGPDAACPDGSVTLLPGQSATFTASYTVTQADLDNGSLSDSAVARATTADDNPVPDTTPSDVTVPVHVTPATPDTPDVPATPELPTVSG